MLHPDQMPGRVVHFLPLRIDTFGATCFAISFVTQCALGISRAGATSGAEAE